MVIFTNQNSWIKNGRLQFPRPVSLPLIKTRVKTHQQVRILPRRSYYIIEIVYNQEKGDLLLDKTRVLSIDLGINNLITTANTIEQRPLLVKGGIVKSINQWYNKVRAINRSLVDPFHIETMNMNVQTRKRNNKIKDYFHKTSQLLMEYSKTNDIGTIIIEYNKKWKQASNIGVRNNQAFVSIPHLQLIKMIQYKARLSGIDVFLMDESYTSKCSALDNEPIGRHSTYMGKRIK